MGQPTVLILDEPTNGLDPEGIAWLRDLLRWQADQGCTVLVSSHRLAEVAQSADDVVILNEGRLVREQPLAALLEGSRPRVRVRTPQAAALAVALADFGIGTTAVTATELLVDASDPAAVGAAAMRVGAELHLLAPERPDLEQVFLSLVDDSPDGGLR
jgi:ABC-2 type transport system ATP-binding protein